MNKTLFRNTTTSSAVSLIGDENDLEIRFSGDNGVTPVGIAPFGVIALGAKFVEIGHARIAGTGDKGDIYIPQTHGQLDELYRHPDGNGAVYWNVPAQCLEITLENVYWADGRQGVMRDQMAISAMDMIKLGVAMVRAGEEASAYAS